MELPEVITLTANKLQKMPFIHAMWLEGSYATGKFNEQSDIDVWLDVEDGTFDKSIEAFRKALSEIVKIDREATRGVYSKNPALAKQTFFLRDFPPGQEIELDLQEHSRKFVFSETEHVIKVLFDKNNTIKWDSSK